MAANVAAMRGRQQVVVTAKNCSQQVVAARSGGQQVLVTANNDSQQMVVARIGRQQVVVAASIGCQEDWRRSDKSAATRSWMADKMQG